VKTKLKQICLLTLAASFNAHAGFLDEIIGDVAKEAIQQTIKEEGKKIAKDIANEAVHGKNVDAKDKPDSPAQNVNAPKKPAILVLPIGEKFRKEGNFPFEKAKNPNDISAPKHGGKVDAFDNEWVAAGDHWLVYLTRVGRARLGSRGSGLDTVKVSSAGIPQLPPANPDTPVWPPDFLAKHFNKKP
jgi:hypothetical protein